MDQTKVNKLDSQKAPAVAEKETAPVEEEKSKETQFSEALSSQSAAEALSILESCDAELADFGKNDSLMRNVLSLSSVKERNACMDLLYMHVQDTEILKDFAETRFGINLGSGSTQGNNLANALHTTTTNSDGSTTTREERNWDKVGISRLYMCYLALPQSHIDIVDSVLTTQDIVTKGSERKEKSRSGGVAYYDYSSYDVDYNSSTPNNIKGTSYCTDKNDAGYYLPSLDNTIVHELGHLVDGGSHKYGWSEEFMAFNGWIKTANSTKDNKKVAKQIISDCKLDPFTPMESVSDEAKKVLTTEETKLAQRGAELLIKNHVETSSVDEVENVLTEASDSLGYKFGSTLRKGYDKAATALSSAWSWLTKSDNKYEAPDRSVRDLSSLAEHLYSSPVYHHILNTALCYDNGHIPSYQIQDNGTTSYMNKATCEGYKGRQVWTFDLSNWSNKISEYQFRCPEEDFAETYACYHVSKMQRQLHEGEANAETKYKGIRSDVQDWFVRMNLHQDPPTTSAKSSSEPLGH